MTTLGPIQSVFWWKHKKIGNFENKTQPQKKPVESWQFSQRQSEPIAVQTPSSLGTIFSTEILEYLNVWKTTGFSLVFVFLFSSPNGVKRPLD